MKKASRSIEFQVLPAVCLGRAKPNDFKDLIRPMSWMFPTPALQQMDSV